MNTDMENNNTPLWLDLRTEYIDDNFEKLIPYLKQNCGQVDGDSFYATTLSLLRRRVKGLVDGLAHMPIYEEEKERERDFNVRLLAVYLLVEPNGELALTAFAALMEELMGMVQPNQMDSMMHAVTHRMTQQAVADYGYGWEDVTELKPGILVYKITNAMQGKATLSKTLAYSNYGTALLTKKGLGLYCDSEKAALVLEKQGANSMETPLNLWLCTQASQKLKKSKENDLTAMDDFVKDFILEQYRAKPKKVKTTLLRYAKGDEAVVRIESIAIDGTIVVKTVDSRYETVEGKLHFTQPNTLYYEKQCFSRYLKVGNYVKTEVLYDDKWLFCMEKQFREFVVEDCREQCGYQGMECKLIARAGNKLVWMNALGAPINTPGNPAYNIGDLAIIQIQEYGTGSFYGKISGIIMERSDTKEEFDEKEYQKECVEGFAESTEIPKSVEKREEDNLLPGELLWLLCRLLFAYEKTLLKPSERFRYLGLARVLAEMVGDEGSASFLNFNATYLKILVKFVNREDITEMELEADEVYKNELPTLKRKAILEILKEYGKKENSTTLAETIENFKVAIPMLANLARLVQTANSMQGMLSDAALNVIRREIIKTLSLETENDADLESESKNFLGLESGTQEFKTSMIYPAGNNMQPNETQQNLNVMKGICAFLNSTTGGVMYLGVNDQGYVTGLKSDLKYLGFSDMDHYIRYVQDCALRMLGKDCMVYLNRTEPMYDNQVVAIHVEPHPYRVVELNGVAYLRVNAESREMPENTRQELIAKKVFKDKNKAAALSHLEHAFSQQKCVMLHNYASNNSGNLTNRHVEAYNVLSEDGLVICYDLDKHGIRVFNISRIGYVEVLENEPWQHMNEHVVKTVDTFHMTGELAMNISLQLDLMAKNLLVEEFPRAKAHITQQKGDENTWYYTDSVYAMEGIGRFYIGLANHIKILSAPELEKYVKEYKEKYL